MRPPFVVRIDANNDDAADRAARLVATKLDQRGLLVSTEAEADAPVQVLSCATDQPGALLNVGLRRTLGGPRWLAPVPLRGDTEEAAQATVEFLERWGFIGRTSEAQTKEHGVEGQESATG